MQGRKFKIFFFMVVVGVVGFLVYSNFDTISAYVRIAAEESRSQLESNSRGPIEGPQSVVVVEQVEEPTSTPVPLTGNRLWRYFIDRSGKLQADIRETCNYAADVGEQYLERVLKAPKNRPVTGPWDTYEEAKLACETAKQTYETFVVEEVNPNLSFINDANAYEEKRRIYLHYKKLYDDEVKNRQRTEQVYLIHLELHGPEHKETRSHAESLILYDQQIAQKLEKAQEAQQAAESVNPY